MKEKLAKLLNAMIDENKNKNITTEITADYLIQNGVIVPPVKVGDPVFRIRTWDGKRVVEGKISMIKQKSDLSWKFRGIGRYFEGSCDYTIADIGTTIFLTREDAEKKLKEYENENNV